MDLFLRGFPKSGGYLFASPFNKDFNSLGSELGSPCLG